VQFHFTFKSDKEVIEEAKKAGADGIKLQTCKPDTITLNCDGEEFKISGGLWDGRTCSIPDDYIDPRRSTLFMG
jgi:sialic acid synthase SpsE